MSKFTTCQFYTKSILVMWVIIQKIVKTNSNNYKNIIKGVSYDIFFLTSLNEIVCLDLLQKKIFSQC